MVLAWKQQRFKWLNLRGHFCHILLVTESHPDAMWKGTTQECDYGEVTLLGVMLKADYHSGELVFELPE